MVELASVAELGELEAFISAAFATQQLENPAVVAIEKIGQDPHTWYVRFSGEAKAHYSAEFTLGQRSLHFASYFIPAPEQDPAGFYRHLLQRNARLFGMAFTVGAEDAVYIEGRLPNGLVTVAGQLDRILGSLFAYTEEQFPVAAKLGFPARVAK